MFDVVNQFLMQDLGLIWRENSPCVSTGMDASTVDCNVADRLDRSDVQQYPERELVGGSFSTPTQNLIGVLGDRHL